MTTYFDTSALVAIYVTEAFSPAARREAKRAGTLPMTYLHDLELTNALRLLRGRGRITDGELDQLLGHVEEDRSSQRLLTCPVDLPEVFRKAQEISANHTAKLLCRSLDVLHISAAIHLECDRLVSGDDRQLSVARALGLDVVDIKQRR